MTRPHPKCWNEAGQVYQHICQKPSGLGCYEYPCPGIAGTNWGPYWCPEHDVERLQRISNQLHELLKDSGE